MDSKEGVEEVTLQVDKFGPGYSGYDHNRVPNCERSIYSNKILSRQELCFLELVSYGIAPEKSFNLAFANDSMVQELKYSARKNKMDVILNSDRGRGYLQAIQTKVAERNLVTADSLMQELEEARIVAKENGNAGQMVMATLGKAKLSGVERMLEVEMKKKEKEAKLAKIPQLIIQHVSPDETPPVPVSYDEDGNQVVDASAI